MTPSELLAELERRGIILRPEGDAIHYTAPKGAMTDELREAIRRHKPEIIALLRHNGSWPPECLEAEQRFGCPEARLYPLLGKTVRTPEGTGTLWQVLSAKRIGVVLGADGQRHVAYFSLEEVEPSGPH